jgi:adenylosuccinate synthase
MNIVGAGTVVNFETMAEELDSIAQKGVEVNNLFIDVRAHLIMPYHRVIDAQREKKKGDQKIGTTGRGIGPTYEDKATRRGIRFADLLDPDLFAQRLAMILEEKNFYLEKFFAAAPLDPDPIILQYRQFADRLGSHVTNVSREIADAAAAGQQILFEGAQEPIWTSTTAPTPS